MMRYTLAALAILAAAPAFAQTNITRTPLGGGWSSVTGTVNGVPVTGTTAPLGGGWSSTTLNGPGGSTTCTTAPLGGGWTSTNCN